MERRCRRALTRTSRSGPRRVGGRCEDLAHELSRRVLLARRDRVLEVGDDCVAVGRERLDELALVAARSEEEGADVGEVGGRGAVVCQTFGTCQLDSRPEVRHKRKPLDVERIPGGRSVKAVVFHEFGGLDVLRLEELPDPEPAPGEVLIDITASALNHLDVDVREGVSRFPVELPFVLGVEVVGRIAALGEGVEGWQVGDRVMPLLMDTCGECRFCRTGRESLCLDAGLHQLLDLRRLRGAARLLGATAAARSRRV